MMSPYRKRFIQFNMLLIGIVLTIMVIAVAIYMRNDYYNSLRVTMEQIVAPLKHFSAPPNGEPPQDRPNWERPKREEEKDILTVFYSPESGEYSILSQNNSLEVEDLPSLLDTIVKENDDFGILREEKLIYYRSGNTPYKIAIASTTYITHSMFNLAFVLLGIWIIAMLIFLLISIRLSYFAAKPMEDAMLREKQFIADASHDLKTPLSVILANNSILLEDADIARGSARRWVDSTQEAAKRMQLLISQMLTLSEVERPDLVLSYTEVDLAEVATKVALEMEGLAYEKNITLETKLPDSCIIQGNTDYLERITSSLVENAFKYEIKGGRVILSLVKEKKKVLLSVQNVGSTINEEDIPHVFDRFYRSDKSRKNEKGSFGLGLAITKEMTEKLGGKITVESNQEIGTIFKVSFEL